MTLRHAGRDTSMSNHAKKIIVNLDRQVVFAYQSGECIFTFDCVSGDKQHATPVGHYRVLRKEHPCISREFNVPMDYALFFTSRGHALHKAVPIVVTAMSYAKSWGIGSDYFGSHGCVRLDGTDASALYKWADIGTPVHIETGLPSAAKAA
jgi:lipoprotein-anchoring transpeptidase ErfK/SrfK